MHVAAQRADAASGHGRPDRLHRVTLDNFDAIRSGLADATGCTRLDELQRDLDASFAGVADTMERRRRDGFVRECHGDLHCGNVVRWQGRLVAFDGLEFDPALRFIDVANDIAFLTMDLAAHGRSELRHALLETWTAASGDYAAVALLPYYERYRALVRAKVAVLRGGQSAEANVESQRSARQYLAWASARGQPHRPRLVVMVGLSGSGKTWLARRLATACEALHLRSDVERKRLAGLGPLDDSRSPPDGGLYTREFGERTYARLRECAHSCLAGGANVIVDAANLRHDERSGFLRLGQEFGADVRLVHCHAPLATLKQRVAMRRTGTADASEATVELRGGVNRPPMHSSASATLYPLAERAAERVGLGPIRGTAVGGGSDGNFTAAVGVPTLDGLGAVGGGAHADHEHVLIDTMVDRARLVTALIEEIRAGG